LLERLARGLSQPRFQYIEIADRPEQTGEPLQLILERPGPIALQEGAESAERAPQPARRGAHSVHPLHVALPRRRVVLAQTFEALGERLAEDPSGAVRPLVAGLAIPRWPIQLSCGGTVVLTVVRHRDHRSNTMAPAVALAVP